MGRKIKSRRINLEVTLKIMHFDEKNIAWLTNIRQAQICQNHKILCRHIGENFSKRGRNPPLFSCAQCSHRRGMLLLKLEAIAC